MGYIDYIARESNMRPVQRIISLVPSTTEVLFFLGLGERVAGVTEHCDFPEEAKAGEKVGNFARPRLEKIISLKPDLVLADSALHGKITEDLQHEGVRVLAYSPSCVEEIFQMMSEIGQACGIEAAVGPAVDSLRERVRRLGRESGGRRPRVFRLMSTDPFITPGPGSFQYDALRLAGARLMDFGAGEPYIKVEWEKIKEFDPEVLLSCGVEKGQAPPPRCKGCAVPKPICQRTVDDIIGKGWGHLTAVRENRVYPIPCHTICRPGPRLVDGMEQLHSRYFNL